MVVSGINEGPNLGNDVFISGTVGAALQGYFYTVPSLAISVAACGNIYFNTAAKLARLFTARIWSGDLPPKILLNINLPNSPRWEIKGVEVTRLGMRNYTDIVQEGHDGRRNYYWIIRGKPQWHQDKDTDIWALEQDKVSITPLGYNLTSSSIHALLKELCPAIFHELCYHTD